METPANDQRPCNCSIFEDPEMGEGSYVICGTDEIVCNAGNDYVKQGKGHYGLGCINGEYFMMVTIEETKHLKIPITHCPFCGNEL